MRSPPSQLSSTKWITDVWFDSANGGFGKNEGDNEVTGAHVSNGDPGPEGVLGTQGPELGHDGWRWFYTQQHGDNPTYEVLVGQHPHFN